MPAYLTRSSLRPLAVWSLAPATLVLGGVALFAAPGGLKSPAPRPTLQRTPSLWKRMTGARLSTPQPEHKNSGVVSLAEPWQQIFTLEAGKTVEINVSLERVSSLPPNGRIAVEWTLSGGPKGTLPEGQQEKQDAGKTKTEYKHAPGVPRRPDAFGIYTLPTANWRKVLHALDGDVYLTYRAPVSGKYTLKISPVTDELPVGDAEPRWREKGTVPMLASLPRITPWPQGASTPVRVSVRPVNFGSRVEQDRFRMAVECEPNDTPEQAQPITLTQSNRDEVRTWEITGTSDDVEFFDNGRVGKSGDDWFRLDYKGTEPRLLTAQLSLPGQTLAARIRAYRLDLSKEKSENQHDNQSFLLSSTPLLPLVEYHEGQEPNERVHQQDEEHRANITRMLKPKETIYLRVEANAPGYQLQLRVVPPAPYDDPHMAVRQGVYTQIGQVDAWLTNRPRGASLDRRIRDTGNLLGTQCMSCHTQSGVWGPAVPFQNGYRVENPQNYWHLVNVMYECLRPTNELKEAANNTSLAPLDLGDGPAGTRAAGFNVVHAERVLRPRKLHAKQQVRTANFILQSGDPGGINAAGPGSNIGFVIVCTMATEIVRRAWEDTGDPRYFSMMEEKAQKVLEVTPQFTDDVALRLHYFARVFPLEKFGEWWQKSLAQRRAQGIAIKVDPEYPAKFTAKVRAQLAQDEARLRAGQFDDGTWGFSPATTSDAGKTWKRGDGKDIDPSPTALGIWGLTAAGATKEDPQVEKAVKALLRMQEPAGRWNKAAQTGFVTSAYALHALSRLYPVSQPALKREDYTAKKNDSLLATLKRVQALALSGESKFADLLLEAARNPNSIVRYWANIGLGATNPEGGVPVLVSALSDPSKPTREAATWALRQTLLDDKGWNAVLAAGENGDDRARAQVAQVLNMRADAVMPKARLSWTRLIAFLDKAMNRDANPATRAWATKAAWQWWVWNPPVRTGLNAAWVKLLERPEPNALVENTLRYSSQALFIANGHKANGSKEHQYKELAQLFGTLAERLDETTNPSTKARLATRIVGVGATFFQTSGGDGGPGQMGYTTDNAGSMMGKAVLAYLDPLTKGDNALTPAQLAAIRIGLEGGANVPYQPLTKFLVDYSLKGPEEVRQLAASSVSDPRSVSLAAVPELVEPQLAQVKRGAGEPGRRAQISDPILDLWSRVNWVIPKTKEQQRNFFNLIIPKLDGYFSPAQIAAMTDAAQKAQAEKDMDAAWYLADRLGAVMERNPDLHHEIVFFEYFPGIPRNPLEEHFWVRNVEWLLTFAGSDKSDLKANAAPIQGFRLATFGTQKQDKQTPDPVLTVKDRALQMYLDALTPTADPRTRAIAIRKANATALRKNPRCCERWKPV